MQEVMPRARIVVRRPMAETHASEQAGTLPHAGFASLRGLRVGLRTEGQWMSWIAIVEDWRIRLEADGAIVDVLTTNPYKLGDDLKAEKRCVAEWAARLDFGISGLGTCGSCTAYTVTDGVEIARAGKPALLAVTAAFAEHANSIASHLGYPQLRSLVLPHPLEGSSGDSLRAIAQRFYPQFLRLAGVRT